MEEGELSNSPDITNDIDEDDWVPQEKLELLGNKLSTFVTFDS